MIHCDVICVSVGPWGMLHSHKKTLYFLLSLFCFFFFFRFMVMLLFLGLTLLVKFVVSVLCIPASVLAVDGFDATVVAGGAPVRVVRCVA